MKTQCRIFSDAVTNNIPKMYILHESFFIVFYLKEDFNSWEVSMLIHSTEKPVAFSNTIRFTCLSQVKLIKADIRLVASGNPSTSPILSFSYRLGQRVEC